MMNKDTQSNRYQLTINNPVEKQGYSHEEIKTAFIENFTTLIFLAMCDEIGVYETYHTHIFVCFSSRVRFSMIKRYFPLAHIEVAKGSVTDNVNYLKKTGKWAGTEKSETSISDSYEEYGSQPPDSKGRRDDMSELYRMVQDGMTNADILSVNQDYILHIDKIDKLRTTILTERFRDEIRTDLKVIYICGETGTFKTSSVLKEYGARNVYRVTDYDHPFDGYTCQPVIAFDEFRSSLKLKDMLNYCDIYPIELPARYSNKFCCYNRVFIISNWNLESQYEELQKKDRVSWDAFLRRIHEVRLHTKNGVTTYCSVRDYLNREEDFQNISDDDWHKLPFN